MYIDNECNVGDNAYIDETNDDIWDIMIVILDWEWCTFGLFRQFLPRTICKDNAKYGWWKKMLEKISQKHSQVSHYGIMTPHF